MITIDLTVAQFSQHLRNSIGATIDDDGIPYVFCESDWHNRLCGTKTYCVDDNWIGENWIKIEFAINIFGDLPKCIKIRSRAKRQLLGVLPDDNVD